MYIEWVTNNIRERQAQYTHIRIIIYFVRIRGDHATSENTI